MKRLLLLIGFVSTVNLFLSAKDAGTESKMPCFYLTIQAENGTFRQKTNKDGSITCIIKPCDLIRINSVFFNGKDVSDEVRKNTIELPPLTRNSTLEVNFDSTAVYYPTQYLTIAAVN